MTQLLLLLTCICCSLEFASSVVSYAGLTHSLTHTAGGYDTKVRENVEYHDFLYDLGTQCGFRCYSPVRDGGSASGSFVVVWGRCYLG